MAIIIDYEYDGKMQLNAVTITDDGDTATFYRGRRARFEEYPDSSYLRCTGCKIEYRKTKMPNDANYCPHCGAEIMK